MAIGRRRVLFASALGFRPFLRLSPPLLVCLTFLRTRPHAIGSLLGFVGFRFHSNIGKQGSRPETRLPSILDVHSACGLPSRPGSSPAMCRWLVYCGSDPILMSDLIFAPTNSLIHQSFNGGFHPGAPPREISAHQHAFTIASASRPLRLEQHAGRRSPRDTPTQLASHRWRRLSPRALLRSPHLTEYCPTHPVPTPTANS